MIKTDDNAKTRAAAQIAHAHTDAELTRILTTVDSDMADRIRAAAAKLGRHV
jgi:hypothetical protein